MTSGMRVIPIEFSLSVLSDVNAVAEGAFSNCYLWNL